MASTAPSKSSSAPSKSSPTKKEHFVGVRVRLTGTHKKEELRKYVMFGKILDGEHKGRTVKVTYVPLPPDGGGRTGPYTKLAGKLAEAFGIPVGGDRWLGVLPPALYFHREIVMDVVALCYDTDR